MTDGRSPEERERARLERERRRAARNGDAEAGAASVDTSAREAASREAAARNAASAAASGQTTVDAPDPGVPGPPVPTSRPGPRQTPSSRSVEASSISAGRSDAAARPPGSGRHARRRGIALLTAAAFAVVIWAAASVFQPFAGDGAGAGSMAVNIPRGSSVAEIGKILAKNEVVPNARIFRLRAGWSGKSGEFEAGDYLFGKDMSYAAAIDLLVAGPNAGQSTFTVVEGRSRRETAREWAKSRQTGDYLQASIKNSVLNPRRFGAPAGVKDLEGFLFPATYDNGDKLHAARLVTLQLKAFLKHIRQVPMSYARSKNLNTFDVVTIASLIEREVQVPRERKLVAAVIYNRLKQGIPLGIDATTRFETDNWTEPLTNATLRKDTPYNTRINRGLPPGPIGSPGLESLKAAARPARVGYIYYVANPCKPGTHSFSSTAEQFQRDVERYQRAREAAGGRQPRGC